MGKRGSPNKDGYRVPYPKGDFDAVLGRFEGEDVVVELQNGWKTSDLKSVRGGRAGEIGRFEFDLFFKKNFSIWGKSVVLKFSNLNSNMFF